jgi:hypothetical protein
MLRYEFQGDRRLWNCFRLATGRPEVVLLEFMIYSNCLLYSMPCVWLAPHIWWNYSLTTSMEVLADEKAIQEFMPMALEKRSKQSSKLPNGLVLP